MRNHEKNYGHAKRKIVIYSHLSALTLIEEAIGGPLYPSRDVFINSFGLNDLLYCRVTRKADRIVARGSRASTGFFSVGSI